MPVYHVSGRKMCDRTGLCFSKHVSKRLFYFKTHRLDTNALWTAVVEMLTPPALTARAAPPLSPPSQSLGKHEKKEGSIP